MRLFIKVLSLICVALLIFNVQAQDTLIQKIQIQGLQGLSRDTILSDLPVKIGQPFSTLDSERVIQTLYASGFFDNVSLSQEDGTLIIKVVERPIISRIKVTGNKNITQEKIEEIQKKLTFVPGEIFNPVLLQRFISELNQQYNATGRYAVQIVPQTEIQPHNRVAIEITITEGSEIQITRIQIIGNKFFSEKTLLNELPISRHRIWSFLTGNDKYNSQRMKAALDSLRDFYLNHGFLKFKILSHNVVFITQDRAAITIRISEGPQYILNGYRIIGETYHIPLNQLITLKTKQPYSQKTLTETQNAIQGALGNLGYALANIRVDTDINEQERTVDLTLNVNPGRRIYVRHIVLNGNLKTEDEVFRRLLRQQEGSVFSTESIQESIKQLSFSQLLDKSPEIVPSPVPDAPDLVDLVMNLSEAHAAQALVSFGYGTNGALFSASLNQTNTLGTGNNLALNFTHTKGMTQYNVSYLNPYYTLDGIQRGFDLFYLNSNPQDINATRYSSDSFGGDVRYVIPIDAQGDNLQLSAGAQRLLLKLPDPSQQSLEVQNFVQNHGSQFNQILLTSGWSRTSVDRLLFPTKGLSQNANLQLILPAGGNPLEYYKLNYNGQVYYPLFSGFVGTGRVSLGYGDGFRSELPFFANYYAGGVGYDGQVRGYEASTLGPRDSLGYPLGGNILTVGSLALIFPPPISRDNVRVSIFVDGGNVYSTLGLSTLNHPAGGTSAGPLRFSSGLAVDWRIPVLNVTFSVSLARAINPRLQDQTQAFQFSFGTGF
jgi:outer membrane protein insertion porin family